ncbi:MAG: NUDIX domain-containing protein, partial [Planctomycetes bacterium]|nr:NUDIX domain-containing protein [Planctomycetota bacterium]
MSRRTAAALLITRGDGQDRAVFLVERSLELRFFGGYWALPGGTLAPEDGDASAPAGLEAALQRCALRELFEETGLLRHDLPQAKTTREALAAARAAMLAAEGKDAPPPAGPSPWAALVADAAPP